MKYGSQLSAVFDDFRNRSLLVVPIGAVVTRAFSRVLLGFDGDMSGSAISLLYGLKEFRMGMAVSTDEMSALVAQTAEAAGE